MQKLRDVERAYQASIANMDDNELRRDFSDKLWIAHHTYVQSTDDVIQAEMLKYWIYEIEYFLMRQMKQEHARDEAEDIDKLTKLVLQHDLLDMIIDDYQNANVLAYACLKRIVLDDICRMHPESYKVSEIITKWTGKTHTHEIETSLKAATDILYGPAVWGFYRDEVEKDEDFPALLWKLQLPLPRLNSYRQNNVAVTLPGTF